MRARVSKEGLTLRVVAGTNNVLLCMDLADGRRQGCLGFSIERINFESGERRWLPNMLRFQNDASQDATTARAPLQTFRWGDYTTEPGRRYCYRVVARYETAAEIVQLGSEVERSGRGDLIPGGVVVEIRTEDNRQPGSAVFFNRGAAASKAYNDRYGDHDPRGIPDALRWLSRGLEEAIIAFLAQATDEGWALHAAIYEFQKPELLAALQAAKTRGVDVSVVFHARQRLADHKPDLKDKTRQKNLDAIKQVGLDFVTLREADPQDAIMHNKFVVLLRKDGQAEKPMAVWTGSTNWTEGGIYGQLNVGHAVYDEAIARAYEDYFKLLHADETSGAMKKGTARITSVPAGRNSIPHGITPIFSPQNGHKMLDLYAEVCQQAHVLMVCAPFALHPEIRKVFNEIASDRLRFLLGDKEGSFGLKSEVEIVRRNTSNKVSVATVLGTRLNDFQGRMLQDNESFHHPGVHIHSKIILADPFGQDPILITGSANFSTNSAQSNDSNSLIFRGDTAVADIYATEFMRMFEHYWFRSQQLASGEKTATLGLTEDDRWSAKYYVNGTPEEQDRKVFAGLAM